MWGDHEYDQYGHFILPSTANEATYTHRTESHEIAEQILKHGLYYLESFQKTTDEVLDDPIHMRYLDSLRKYYGDILVVIGISIDLLNEIHRQIPARFEAQQVLSLIQPSDFNNIRELKLLLPKEYIKGFYDLNTEESVLNPEYNPQFVPSYFEDHLTWYRSNQKPARS